MKPARTKKKYFTKNKLCRFCTDREYELDYKHIHILKFYLTERAKIIPARITGNCSYHQRALNTAVNRARQLAFIPYTAVHENV